MRKAVLMAAFFCTVGRREHPTFTASVTWGCLLFSPIKQDREALKFLTGERWAGVEFVYRLRQRLR